MFLEFYLIIMRTSITGILVVNGTQRFARISPTLLIVDTTIESTEKVKILKQNDQ